MGQNLVFEKPWLSYILSNVVCYVRTKMKRNIWHTFNYLDPASSQWCWRPNLCIIYSVRMHHIYSSPKSKFASYRTGKMYGWANKKTWPDIQYILKLFSIMNNVYLRNESLINTSLCNTTQYSYLIAWSGQFSFFFLTYVCTSKNAFIFTL